MIEIALRAYLLEQPEIRSIVGERIYPLALPENCAFPAIVYERTSTTRDYTMGGPSGQVTANIDLKFLAMPNAGQDQYLAVKQLAAHVRLALDGYTERGPLARGHGTPITRVFIESESDDVFAPAHDEGQDSMGVSMTLDVAFTEPVRKFQGG